jgi:glycosyltransferase involved in cell wall biosynthesis
MTAGQSLYDRLAPLNDFIINIENGFDPDLFHPISRQEARTKIGIPGDVTVIGYLGSIETDLGIESMIEAVDLLRKDIPKLSLLIAGFNAIKLDFTKYGVDYRGFLAQEEIPYHINACDVVVIPYLPSEIKKYCNACKIAEYIACGIPIVATEIADHAAIFAEAPQTICKPGDPTSMANAIQSQLESPQLIKRTEKLTWKKLAEKLSESFEALLN